MRRRPRRKKIAVILITVNTPTMISKLHKMYNNAVIALGGAGKLQAVSVAANDYDK